MEESKELTRKNVLKELAGSKIYGNLGLFIGAGFSKAVLDDKYIIGALSWGELIEKACDELSIAYDESNFNGMSYPEIATDLCESNANEQGISYEESKKKFKMKICKLTNWYPNEEQRNTYSKYLTMMDPKWIITTNYDLVIESLLPGRSISLSPEDYLTSCNRQVEMDTLC